MQITGGRVVYCRTVQPAQFESKRAEVELSFVLAENEALGAALEQAANLAKSQALTMVGQQEQDRDPPRRPERPSAPRYRE
jgi:hypothetical protein